MKKKLMTLMTIALMAVTAAGCGQKKDTKADLENMTEDEFIDALDNMDEDELDALFDEALGGDNETVEENTTQIITSFSQITDEDWEVIVDSANYVLKHDLVTQKTTFKVYLSDGTGGKIALYAEYTNYLSNLRPYEAYIVTRTKAYDDGYQWTESDFYILCYIDGQGIQHYNTDGTREDDISVNDLTIVISLSDGYITRNSSGDLSIKYYSSYRNKILCLCDTQELFDEYLLEESEKSEFFKDMQIEHYDISSLEIVLPDIN